MIWFDAVVRFARCTAGSEKLQGSEKSKILPTTASKQASDDRFANERTRAQRLRFAPSHALHLTLPFPLLQHSGWARSHVYVCKHPLYPVLSPLSPAKRSPEDKQYQTARSAATSSNPRSRDPDHIRPKINSSSNL